MITATRQLARELEDGSLEVVLHVHQQYKPECFAAFPKAGTWIALAPAEKPPTQGAAATGAEPPKTPIEDAGLNLRIVNLVRNPWFQQYVDERGPNVAGADAEQRARTYIRATAAGIGGLTSPKALDMIVASFNEWCDAKGYRQDA